MFIITPIIFIPITQQPEQDRLAENQPTAGLSSLNENVYENGMRKSETELLPNKLGSAVMHVQKASERLRLVFVGLFGVLWDVLLLRE